ncbi:MAG TPA: NPCBM/NEW2 domain-containing protein, partial [Caulifigura sp.]|nr:NPCBM/NEW2 domain-containing protein [Caulifigura sp.]
MNRRRILACLLLSLAGFAHSARAVSEEFLAATVQLQNGRTVAGKIISIDANELLLSVDGRRHQFPIDDLVAIDFSPAPAQSTLRSWLLLSNGDRAPLTPIDLVDDAFLCRWEDATQPASWRVPLELVTALLRQPLNVKEEAALLPELSRRAFTEDTLILSDGTRLAGALEGVTADTFRVETAVGIVPVEAARVAAVAMNAALVQRPEPAKRSALVILRDGTWLTLHDLAISTDQSLTGRTGFDAELKVPLADVARIACYGPHVIELSRRTPLNVTTVQFVSRKQDLQINRNVRGGWLELDGRSHARGLGMTSGMSATFDLEPGDRQFEATVGIDDSVGP